MPEMIPVANTIQPPNLSQTVGTLGGLIGLKQKQVELQQQQQNVQTGAIRQQEAAAVLQQQQLKSQQQQGIQDFFNTWDPAEHIGSDGTTDLDSALQSKEFKAAGNAKPAIMQSLLDLKNKQLTNKQSLTTLNSALLTQFDSQVGALAKDKDVEADTTDPATGVNPGRAKVQQYINNFSKLSPDAARVAQIYSPLTQHTPQGKLSVALQALQMSAQSASEQQAQQNPKQIAVPTGAATNIYNVQPATGLEPGQTPVQAIPNQLPPQVVTPPGGVPQIIGGNSGGIKPQYPGPAPTDQDVQAFGDYQKNLNSRVQTAADSIPRIRLAEQALDQIRAGGGAQGYTRLARILQAVPGMPQSIVDQVGGGSLAAAQEAEKMLFQTTMTGLRQSMQGDPARVAEFQAAEKVFPDIGTDPRASKRILQFMEDQGNRDFAEQQALVHARMKGTFNPATWQADYQAKLRAGKVSGSPASQNPAKSVTRTGTYKGKKVVQYSDGSIDYGE